MTSDLIFGMILILSIWVAIYKLEKWRYQDKTHDSQAGDQPSTSKIGHNSTGGIMPQGQRSMDKSAGLKEPVPLTPEEIDSYKSLTLTPFQREHIILGNIEIYIFSPFPPGTPPGTDYIEAHFFDSKKEYTTKEKCVHGIVKACSYNGKVLEETWVEKMASRIQEAEKDRNNQSKEQDRWEITWVEMSATQKTEMQKVRQKQELQRKKEALQAFHDGPFTRFLELRDQVIKEARPTGNWQLQYQSSSVGQQVDYSCRYDGNIIVNIFKTLAHLQAFLRDTLSDDGNIHCHTGESRSFGWTLNGVYHALHYSAYVINGYIWLNAWGINQDNLAVLEDLVPRFEDFFVHGHPDAVTDRINPTSIGVETHFSVHDGGYADLVISYESGLTETHDLWDASCYTPPDMQGDGGLLQNGLWVYLEKIKNLEVYY